MNGATAGRVRRYRCECLQEFQVFGLGRQRRFYQLDGLGWTRPVMTKTCPHCQRTLPSIRLEAAS